MSWTAPMTAVTNDIWTSAQWNTYVRDNMLETEVAKAANLGGYFVTTSVNGIAERRIANNAVNTSETRASATYGDLATVGPSVTVTTGTRALVWIQSTISNSVINGQSRTSFAVSGATTVAAGDEWSIELNGTGAGGVSRWGVCRCITSLTTGSNIFTMKYAADNTGTFANRHIVVMPL